jgi:hypothetical protein
MRGTPPHRPRRPTLSGTNVSFVLALTRPLLRRLPLRAQLIA